MQPAKIKTDEERKRLDRIFAEVEAAERGESAPEADARTQQQIDEDNRRAKIKRLANLLVKDNVIIKRAVKLAYSEIWLYPRKTVIAFSIADLYILKLIGNFRLYDVGVPSEVIQSVFA